MSLFLLLSLCFYFCISTAQEKKRNTSELNDVNGKNANIQDNNSRPLVSSVSEASELFKVEFEVNSKNVFAGQPFYFQVKITRFEDTAPGKEFRSSCNILVADENRTLESLRIKSGRFNDRVKRELLKSDTSCDVAFGHFNDSVHADDMKTPGVYYLTASCSVVSPVDFPQHSKNYKSAPVAITVRKPTPKEQIALALITENFSKLQQHFSASQGKFDEVYSRKQDAIMAAGADKCRSLLQDPNLPLRNELKVHLGYLLEQLVSSRYTDKLERKVLLEERLSLLVQFPIDNLSIDERYLQWAAYFGSDWSAESPPTKFMRQLEQIVKQPATVEFDWSLMEQQWRSELPILPQTCELDIEQVYAPTKKLIEKLAEMQK